MGELARLDLVLQRLRKADCAVDDGAQLVQAVVHHALVQERGREHGRREQPPREGEAEEATRGRDQIFGRRVQQPPGDALVRRGEPRDAAQPLEHEHGGDLTAQQTDDEREPGNPLHGPTI